MAGWNNFKQVQDLILLADKMGLTLGPSQFNNSYERDGNDYVALKFNDDERYPTMNHDRDLYTHGTSEVKAFISGMEWMKQYYETLYLVSDKKVKRKEQDVLNKQLMNKLKKENK